ncbi:bifunctional adenosylcobinamide kinase/adenosylcobinamide-phosphate guanylyltransferase [Acidimangrovimonas pyrenivorans]|uniref:Bifunctional adenosylcobalamin biosynthesis protein n=1 Tax=Acidimangrovimonas pyrenivorans TaxID=2030798 RepID=A0ABV7AIR1_9RHOB
MSKTILVTGGARSGKSRLAEGLAQALGPRPVYIATSEVHDDEMAARVAAHRHRRGPEWRLIEAPLDLVGALEASDGPENGGGPRLVDCLTLWLSNLMLGGHDWRAAAGALAEALAAQSAPVVLVTNEVGAGIVPENALARAYRDAAGLLNQQIAAVCDEVHMAVCGLSLKVKPHD